VRRLSTFATSTFNQEGRRQIRREESRKEERRARSYLSRERLVGSNPGQKKHSVRHLSMWLAKEKTVRAGRTRAEALALANPEGATPETAVGQKEPFAQLWKKSPGGRQSRGLAKGQITAGHASKHGASPIDRRKKASALPRRMQDNGESASPTGRAVEQEGGNGAGRTACPYTLLSRFAHTHEELR